MQRAFYCAGAAAGLKIGVLAAAGDAATTARRTAAQRVAHCCAATEAAALDAEAWMALRSAELLTQAYVTAGVATGALGRQV